MRRRVEREEIDRVVDDIAHGVGLVSLQPGAGAGAPGSRRRGVSVRALQLQLQAGALQTRPGAGAGALQTGPGAGVP
eukprot:scaffold87023_cov45-Phaeocystis_antarctica.AAC.3